MNEQEIFDTVVNHLRTQGHKAMSMTFEDPLRKGEPQCCYLDRATGDKCAAGCLIKPEEYRSTFEGKSIIAILSNPVFGAPLSLVERLYPFRSIIVVLQRIHDNVDVNKWENELQIIAQKYSLQYTPPIEKKDEQGAS